MSRITQMRQKDNTERTFDFGSTFENVTCDYEDGNTIKRFTLKDLYNYLKNFFNNGTFVMYSRGEPANTNVKVWYEITTNE